MRTDENKILHLKYWLLIMSIFLILVACNNWTEKENFTDYLTNAATFVSLVLGIVAIVYSFISNASISSSLGNITKVSDEVSLTKNEISKFLTLSEALTQSSEKNTTLLIKTSGEVQDNVETLNTTLNDINKKTDILQGVVDLLPAKLDHINVTLLSKIEAINNPPPSISTNTNSPITKDAREKIHHEFMAASSASGLMFLLAIKYAFSQEKKLHIDKLIDKVAFSTIDYCNGYRIGCSAIQLFKSELSDETITITSISTVLTACDIKKDTVNRLKSIFSSKEDTETLSKWIGKLDIIEKVIDEST